MLGRWAAGMVRDRPLFRTGLQAVGHLRYRGQETRAARLTTAGWISGIGWIGDDGVGAMDDRGRLYWTSDIVKDGSLNRSRQRQASTAFLDRTRITDGWRLGSRGRGIGVGVYHAAAAVRSAGESAGSLVGGCQPGWLEASGLRQGSAHLRGGSRAKERGAACWKGTPMAYRSCNSTSRTG